MNTSLPKFKLCGLGTFTPPGTSSVVESEAKNSNVPDGDVSVPQSTCHTPPSTEKSDKHD